MGVHEVIALIRLDYPNFCNSQSQVRRWEEEFREVHTSALLEAARRLLRDDHRGVRPATLWKYLRSEGRSEGSGGKVDPDRLQADIRWAREILEKADPSDPRWADSIRGAQRILRRAGQGDAP